MTPDLKKEIELVKKLKNSYPDMLDFNNCLKELRSFWNNQALLSQKEEELNFLKSLFKDDTLQFFKESVLITKISIVKRIEELKQKIEEI